MGYEHNQEASRPITPAPSLSPIIDPHEDTSTFPASHPFYVMDELSEAVTTGLKLEDREQLSQFKGKSVESSVTDTELALSNHEEELKQDSMIIAGQQMTQNISREQRAQSDEKVDLRHMMQNIPPASSSHYLALPADHHENEGPANADSEGESADSAPAGFGGTCLDKRRCVACQNHKLFFYVARAPCGHEYCEECLRDMIECSMTDESLFPPRCCSQPIYSAAVRFFLTAELVDLYEMKKIEFETSKRTYCSSPRCSAFLTPEHIVDDRGICSDCGTVTCTMCKATAHEGDCPADTDLQLVLETALENGWQRCYSCRRLVELDTGCNHITYVLDYSLNYNFDMSKPAKSKQMYLPCPVLLYLRLEMEDLHLRSVG
jgi:hypothetical protein